MNSNSSNNYHSYNNKSTTDEKNDSSSDENNHTLLKDLKNEIDELEKEKLKLLKSVEELREKYIDLNIVNNPEKIKLLEKERDENKKKASDKLEQCSKMGEELIILRDKLDKYYHNKI